MPYSATKILVGLLFAMTWITPCFAGDLPPEPDEKSLISEDVNIVNGLYTREYSLHDNGIVDYRTARQIIISEYNEYWNSIVHTKEHPLFYWYDDDQDGQFDMWVDQKVEGCVCDIVPYQWQAAH